MDGREEVGWYKVSTSLLNQCGHVLISAFFLHFVRHYTLGQTDKRTESQTNSPY